MARSDLIAEGEPARGNIVLHQREIQSELIAGEEMFQTFVHILLLRIISGEVLGWEK